MLPWLQLRRPAVSLDTSHQTERAMVAARPGDSIVVLGATDPGLAAALARITGLNGQVTVVDKPDAASRVAAAAGRVGSLVEFQPGQLTNIPIAPATADVAVMVRALAELHDADRISAASEAFRIVRPGGRLIAIERQVGAGPLGMLRRGRATLRAGEVITILTSVGWKAAREIGEVDGVVYVEATKPRSST